MAGENTLIHPVNVIHFGSYRPEDVPEAMETIIAGAAIEISAIVDWIPDGHRNYENTVQAVHDAKDRVSNFKTLVDHMDAAVGGRWTEESKEVAEKAATFFIALEQSEDLYNAFKHIQDRQTELNLTQPQML
jgi:Zn-dependent oligopeptidase